MGQVGWRGRVEQMPTQLILGGQRSGKSRRAESLAQAWLARSPKHGAVMIATAQAWDDEMRSRIARHQADRLERLPNMRTVEDASLLGQAIARESNPDVMVVVDCLTLWLTGLLMPMTGEPNNVTAPDLERMHFEPLRAAITRAGGPLVIVGNEIGLGVIPMGTQTRAFVDSLGHLNQSVAAVCTQVTLMVAGLPLVLKGPR